MHGQEHGDYKGHRNNSRHLATILPDLLSYQRYEQLVHGTDCTPNKKKTRLFEVFVDNVRVIIEKIITLLSHFITMGASNNQIAFLCQFVSFKRPSKKEYNFWKNYCPYAC